jgi:hypothetical protein
MLCFVGSDGKNKVNWNRYPLITGATVDCAQQCHPIFLSYNTVEREETYRDSWVDIRDFLNWYFTVCMPPPEIAKCAKHPLNDAAILEVLHKVYKPITQNWMHKGDISRWIDWTMSDSADEVGNGLMAVFPQATHLNCNVHHMTKGLQSAGGLRKKLKEDMKAGEDTEEVEVEDEEEVEGEVEGEVKGEVEGAAASSQKQKSNTGQERATKKANKRKRKRRKKNKLDNVCDGVRTVLWALSRLYHKCQHQFHDGLELMYAEYKEKHPKFVQHHQQYYGPAAPEWKQRWSRCFTPAGIPHDDNVCEVRATAVLLLLLHSDWLCAAICVAGVAQQLED